MRQSLGTRQFPTHALICRSKGRHVEAGPFCLRNANAPGPFGLLFFSWLMSPSNCLVLGTHNRKKLRELVELLAPGSIELRTLDDFPDPAVVEETGLTFADNAGLKAVGQAKQLGHWVLAEDSGLIVDSLDGAPGVRSARFSGPQATDASNNALLLERLAGVPKELRTAHYVCHLSLAAPTGELVAECEAECRGRIREQTAGNAGFGYDPLFEIVEYHRTFAELGDAVKRMISHRGRGLRAMIPRLVSLIGS